MNAGPSYSTAMPFLPQPPFYTYLQLTQKAYELLKWVHFWNEWRTAVAVAAEYNVEQVAQLFDWLHILSRMSLPIAKWKSNTNNQVLLILAPLLYQAVFENLKSKFLV